MRKKQRTTLALAVVVGAAALMALGRHADGTAPAFAESGGTAETTSGPVYAVRWQSPGRSGRLTRVDPLTLRVRSRALTITTPSSQSFSPDRTRLALAPDERAELRFVDLRTMRPAGRLQLASYGTVLATAWTRPDRLVAVYTDSLCCPSLSTTTAAVVDPLSRRVLTTTPLPAWPDRFRRSRDGLVLLFSTPNTIGPASLAVLDSEGAIRTVTLDRVQLGSVHDEQSDDPFITVRSPGLAVDREGNRAFLVGAGEPVAEVDLGTLAVSYHELSQPVSLLGRLHDWLEPRAKAKGAEGPSREAKWLGNGLIAVSGDDGHILRDSAGRSTPTWTPAGLSLIDTRTWSVRKIAERVEWMLTAPGLIFATEPLGDRTQAASRSRLRAFDLSGEPRYSVDSASGYGLVAVGSYLYRSGPRAIDVMDAASGKVLRTVRGTNIWILSPALQPD